MSSPPRPAKKIAAVPATAPIPSVTGASVVNAQINFLFPASEAELPSAEKLKGYSPEAQASILQAFEREQQARHEWFKTQQSNDHVYNVRNLDQTFYMRIAGMILGTVLTLGLVLCGAWMVSNKFSLGGYSLMLAAVGGLVGSVLYGHNARKIDASNSADPPSEETPTQKNQRKNPLDRPSR